MSFPTTPILDSGAGSNATPPSGWSADIPGCTPFWGSAADLKRSSNVLAASNTIEDCNGVITAGQGGPNLEGYATISSISGASPILGIVFGDPTQVEGYVFYWEGSGGSWSLQNFTSGGGFGSTIASGTTTLSAGDSIGLSNVGQVFTAWHESGGTWSSVGSGTSHSFTMTSGWYPGLYIGDSSKFTNFGGGTAIGPAAQSLTLLATQDQRGTT